MAQIDVPSWVIEPDWADPVTETLEWKTCIMTSVTGVEQRQKLRTSPRRYLEYTMRPVGRWRAYLDALLTTPEQLYFYVPLWYACSELVSSYSAGDTSIVFKGLKNDLLNSTIFFIQGPKPHLFETVISTGVGVTGSNTLCPLTVPLTHDWPAGTLIYPVMVSELVEQPTYDRLRADIVQSTVKFRGVHPNDWPLEPSLPTYRGYPVFDIPTNYGQAQGGGYDRVLAMLDNDIGVVSQQDIGGIPFQKFGTTTFYVGQTEGETLRSLLYFLKGRLTPAWFVYPSADFELTENAAAAASIFQVERNGFTDLGGATEGRQDVEIVLRNGTAIYRRIISSEVIDDDHENLLFDSPLGIDVTVNTIERISFMNFGRLDQDSVEIVHQTDSEGVAGVSLSIKAVPDLRTAADWSPPALPRTSAEGCSPPGFWYRIKQPADTPNTAFPGIWAPWNRAGLPTYADPSFSNDGFNLLQLITNAPNPPADRANVYAAFNINTDSGMASGAGLRFNFSGPFDSPPIAAVPYGNNTTLNPADSWPSFEFSGDNLEVWLPAATDNRHFGRATEPLSPGLRYFEVSVRATAGATLLSIGFMTDTAPLEGGDTDVSNPYAWVINLPAGYYMLGAGPNTVPEGEALLIGIAIAT